jgi:non-specific serine/threonine protein kinase
MSGEERAVFDRLSVFVGAFTVAAAEAVTGADPEILQSLLDKSMLQRRPGAEARLWMLRSIHAFAAERLGGTAGADDVRAAHARWYLDRVERADADLQRGEPEEVSVAAIDADIDNIRAAVDRGIASDDPDLVRRITVALPMYWTMRDRYAEARGWLERALAISAVEDETRIRLLRSLAAVAYRQGDHPASIAASDEAADLSLRLGGVADRFQDLKLRAASAWERGDLDEAETLYDEAFTTAVEVDNGVGISSCRLNLGTIANQRARHDRADTLFHENLPFVRGRGQSRCEAFTLVGLAETALLQHEPDVSAERAVAAAGRAGGFGEASLAAYALDIAAAALAQAGRAEVAATILGATERAREQLGLEPDEEEVAMREDAAAHIRASIPSAEMDRAWAEGRALELDRVVEIASGAGARAEAEAS